MVSLFTPSFEYKLIYIFEIRDETHKGLLKIGDTTIQTEESIDNLPPNCKALNQAAKTRIKEYTNTAGISFELLHTELAVRTIKDEKGMPVLRAFRDYHEVNFLIECLENDTRNDTTITIPASILVYQKNAPGKKLCEFDGMIIHPNRKSNQVILLEAKNTSNAPSYAKKCLCEKLDKIGYTYNKDNIKIKGYDAYLNLSIDGIKTTNT